MLKKLVGFTATCLFASSITAAPMDYHLAPKKIAENTWVFEGAIEDFSMENGGNIVNTAFIVTDDSVVLIDSGPSLRYGKQVREAISKITSKPISHVLNTHHHPDHFLGNQAFSDTAILARPDTGKAIAQHGNAFSDNMYRMVGDWMRSTEVVLPNQPLEGDKLTVGGHTFRLMDFTGHTGADLVIFDESTGVLFASDMIFYQRALTTPHSPGIQIWIDELKKIAQLKYKIMVPGHGPVIADNRAIDQMVGYLSWMDKTLKASAEAGLSMNEVQNIALPAEFSDIALIQREYHRSVVHLYPIYEEAAF